MISRERANSKVSISNRTRTTSVNDIIANRSIGSGKTSQIQRKGGPVRSITRKAGGIKFTQ